jgi:NAD(P)-dependent dehydrogenase (short-subunit alcohol dehydrogenase family)
MQGKIIALTGGASGIGLSASKILSSRGATVCIADIDPAAISIAEAHFSSQSLPYMITKVDISKRSEVDAWVGSIVEKYGRLDGAANCAGIIGKHHGIRTIAETEDEEWEKIMAVNLTGCFYCLRAELQAVVDGGSIVNVASIQGVMGEYKATFSYQ